MAHRQQRLTRQARATQAKKQKLANKPLAWAAMAVMQAVAARALALAAEREMAKSNAQAATLATAAVLAKKGLQRRVRRGSRSRGWRWRPEGRQSQSDGGVWCCSAVVARVCESRDLCLPLPHG